MPQGHRARKRETIRFNRNTYRILRKIRLRGRPYLVVDEWPNVYKVFDPIVRQMRTIRFRRSGASVERRLLQTAANHNRNLPKVLDQGRDEEGRDYLILEWINGYTLQHYIALGRPGKPYFLAEKSYKLILGLAHGLRQLHRDNIVHGDLKPSNLIVAPSNCLVMIDFGIAWSGARALHRAKKATAGYAAPEQWRSEQLVDHRSDQFSASVILYQMLTGELPYDGLGGRAAEFGETPAIRPPSRRNPNVWLSLDDVVVKGASLAKNERYDTTSEWLMALKLAASPGEFSRFAQVQWNKIVSRSNRVSRDLARRINAMLDQTGLG